MATLCIRDVPETLHAALKERAKRERRSLNAEAITLLDRALQEADLRSVRLQALAELARTRDGLDALPSGLDSVAQVREDRER